MTQLAEIELSPDEWDTVCTGLQSQRKGIAVSRNSRPPRVGLELSVDGTKQLEELRHVITIQKALGEPLGQPIDEHGRLLDENAAHPATGCCAWVYNNLPKMCYYLQWM